MCSIGAFLHGVNSSSMCKATMLDNVTAAVANKVVPHSVGGSIATALRDHRRSCVIPIQPNRSLPVHPAPHHTHRRSSVVRASSRVPSFRGACPPGQGLSPGAPEPVAAEEGALESLTEVAKTEANGGPASGLNGEKYRIEKIEDELMEGLESLSNRTNTDGSNLRMKITWNRDGIAADSTDEGLIDISRSPETIVDLSGDPLADEEASFASGKFVEATSSGCCPDVKSVKQKKKRRKRTKKNGDGNNEPTEDLGFEEFQRSKTVPPLRLKKIQSLRDIDRSIASDWQLRHGLPVDRQTGILNCQVTIRNNEDLRDSGSFGIPNKYRIVTGHTPPYDHPMDCSTLREPRIDRLDSAKLKYKRSKLMFKLGQLRRKTVELGDEMLRSVLSLPNGQHAKRELQIRQKLNRYKAQIEDLEKMLMKFPEVSSSYVEESLNVDCQTYDSSPRQNSTDDFETILSPSSASSSSSSSSSSLSSRMRTSSNSSSHRSSPSLEPPKLSPKFPTNYETSRSPSELRNSPPILPPAYVTITDCTDDSCDGDEVTSSRRRKEHFQRRRSSDEKIKLSDNSKSLGSSPIVISETTINHDDKNFEFVIDELIAQSNYNSKPLVELGKCDLEDITGNSLDVLEVYEDTKSAIETEEPVENFEALDSIVKRATSPRAIFIDKTSSEINETKTLDIRVIDEAKEIPEETESLDDIGNEKPQKKDDDKEIVTLRDDVVDSTSVNGIRICERFPTLGSWIATALSKKQVNEGSNKLPDVIPGDPQPPRAFQVTSPDLVNSTFPQVPQQAPVRAPVTEDAVVEQWRNQPQWQEQPSQQQQQPLLRPYSAHSNLPLPHAQPSPALNQEVCSPITNLAGFYARNYLDHCSMAYAYNPTIAAAASLWNSAAIFQYPLMRPTAARLINSQPSRMPSGNIPFPATPLTQRPSCRFSIHQPAQQQQTIHPNRTKLDNSMNYQQRDTIAKLHSAAGICSSFDHVKRSNPEFQHPVASGPSRMTLNSPNPQTVHYKNLIQQQQQQQKQQLPQEHQQFGRTNYGDSRLGATGAPWRNQLVNSMGGNFNYPAINPWPTNSSNITNPRSSTSTPSFAPPSNVLSMNSSRSRISKASLESNFRNCNTPNLGKVLSNPNTMSIYECSNCGLAGSMFKCLGCEVAFYCDENCQARHWSCHVKSCPKKMPKLKKVVP